MESFVISGLVVAFLSNVVVGILRLLRVGRRHCDSSINDITLNTRNIKDVAMRTKTINSKEADEALLAVLVQLKKDAAENKRMLYDGESLKDKSDNTPVNSRGFTYEK